MKMFETFNKDLRINIYSDGDIEIEIDDLQGYTHLEYIPLNELEEIVKKARQWLDNENKGKSG